MNTNEEKVFSFSVFRWETAAERAARMAASSGVLLPAGPLRPVDPVLVGRVAAALCGWPGGRPAQCDFKRESMFILEQVNLCELSLEWARAGGAELRRSGLAWYWNI